VADLLREDGRAGVPLVVDPVLSATAGGFEGNQDVIEAYLGALLPMAMVVTPNLPELARLSDVGSSALLARGAGAGLVKDGHGTGDTVEDRLLWSGGEVVLGHPRLEVGEVRGTGCALASALACELGRGRAVDEACRMAVATMGRCLALTPGRSDGGAATLFVV
jgi:hydroxymethylpyrimidine/phosphomethylpyrimidine kinase